MGKKAKKFLVVLVALVMVFAVSISLIACKDDEKEKPKKFDNTKAEQYANEIANILADSIDDANLGNGFGMDLDLTIGKTKISIAGNVINKGPENGDANNDFRIEAREGDKLVFGMYNSGENLGITAGGQNFHFKDASIMKVLRMALVQYVPGFDGLGSLGDLELGELGGISDLFRDAVGAVLVSVCKFGPIVENTQASDIKLIDGKYVFKINGDAVKGLLQSDVIGIDASFIPDGTVIECTLEKNSAGSMKSLAVKVNDTNVGVITNDKLFLPVNEEFDAKMPEAISNIEATNILTAEVNSSIQFIANKGNVLRNMTFEMKIDMNPLVLLEGDINAETFKKLGYFTMNIKADVSAETGVAGQMQPLVGVTYYPEKTGTDSLYVYLQLASDNSHISSGLTNMIYGNEFNVSLLLDKLLFGKPNATLDPKPNTDKSSAKMANQLAEGGLIDMSVVTTILDIVEMLGVNTDIITDDMLVNIEAMLDAVKPVRDEDAKASGLDVDVQPLLSNLGKLIGNESIMTEPLLGELSIPLLLFGANLRPDPESTTDIKTIKMRTADGAATFNKPVNAPDFNPNNWITKEFPKEINGEVGYIRSNTIVPVDSEITVEYGTPLKDYLGGSIKVNYTGFDDKSYVDQSLAINDIIGYDPTKPGEQNILIQAGTTSGLQGLLGMAGEIIGDIGSYLSFVPVKLTVNVLPADSIGIEYGNGDFSAKAIHKVGDARVLGKINPVVHFAGRSYNLMENKWMIKEYPAEYDVKADKFKDKTITEHKFVIALAGYEKEFTVQTWNNTQANALAVGTDLFTNKNADKNTFSYFTNGVVSDIQLTHKNFVKAFIGNEGNPTASFELDEDDKLIVAEEYIGQTITVRFNANVYGREITFDFNYEIIKPVNHLVVSINGSATSTTVNYALENLITVRVFEDEQIKYGNLTLKHYARLSGYVDGKDFNKFDYGFTSTYSGDGWVSEANVKIEIFDAARENNLTSTHFVKGMINTAGTYDIKITGSIGDLPLSLDGKNEIWLDDFVVNNYSPSFPAYRYDNILKGQRLDGVFVSFYGVPLAEYPIENMATRIGLDSLVWNEELKSYVIIGQAQVNDDYWSTDLKTKVVNYLEKGVPVDIAYKNSDGEWVDFCDADGLVNFVGSIAAGDLRYTINWGGGETGFEAATYYGVNEGTITIQDTTIEIVADQDTNLFVNEKLPEIVSVYYKDGKRVEDKLGLEAITESGEGFDSTGYLKFTTAGQHTITVESNGITKEFTFNVKSAGLQAPETKLEQPISLDIDVVEVGTSIWDVLVSTGKFTYVVVDENGAATESVCSVQQLKDAISLDPNGGYYTSNFGQVNNVYLDENLVTTVKLSKGILTPFCAIYIEFNIDDLAYKYVLNTAA